MASQLIQVGFLVSYDYNLLKNAIPCIYAHADTIYLAIDKDRKTWHGNDFIIEDAFFNWINEYDKDKKIKIFEESFYIPTLNTMQCETRERRLLSEHMGIGNWLIQIDADEYFLDFELFVNFLKLNNKFLKDPENNRIEISPFLINIYKKVEGGILIVNNATKVIAATNYPAYKKGRQTRKRRIYHKSIILHECLSRTQDELELKLDNWGHNKDIDKNSFMKKWLSVTKDNYKNMQDFFYIQPASSWKSLAFIPGNSIEEYAMGVENLGLVRSSFFIFKKNLGQYFKFLFK